MDNPSAPKELAEYAAEHHVDLAEYDEALSQTRAVRSDVPHPEVPFATHVLARLKAGVTLTDAVTEARATALADLWAP